MALIDTPGFDDTYKSDAEVLEMIATFLAETYSQDMLLTGIILLQPISGNRVQGNELRRTRLFEKICGPGAFSKVIIATTFWDDLKNESQGNRRVQERRTSNDFWGKMVGYRAQITRHDNNPASAQKIIGMLLKNVKPVVLQMQTELAQNDGRVAATSAGRQLDSDLNETSRKLLAELQDLKKESARNTAALRAEMRQLQQKLEDAQNERDRLRDSKVCMSPTLLCIPLFIHALSTPQGVTWQHAKLDFSSRRAGVCWFCHSSFSVHYHVMGLLVLKCSQTYRRSSTCVIL